MPKTKNSKAKRSHRLPFYRRPWALVLFLLALIAAIILAILFLKPRTAEPDSDTPTSTPPSPIVISAGEDATIDSPAEPEKVTQYEGEDPNTLAELTGYLARKSVDGGVLTVAAIIDQYLHSIGYCTIILRDAQGTLAYTASRDAIPDVTASYCETFDIPVSRIGHGTYQIEIELSGDNKQGKIIDEVTL